MKFLGLLPFILPLVAFAASMRNQSASASIQAPADLQTFYHSPFTTHQSLLPNSRLLGAGSCASVACHNNPAAAGVAGREYTIWVSKDKHAHAFDALFSERSRFMQKNLEHAADISKVHPERNTLCLRCHVYPRLDDYARLSVQERRLLSDGVSCEACHGPAEKWISEHYREGWPPDTRLRSGMQDTKSITVRAHICLDCHVGSTGNDANHDLLGSGHPPLNFDFVSFHAKMPHHWDDAKDRRDHPDFETRALVVGQAETVEAALQLLIARTQRNHPWPEFAEYDCYACHHDLQAASTRVPTGHLPGSIAWHTYQAAHALIQPRGKGGQLQKALAGIKMEMEKARPHPRRVAHDAARAIELLKGLDLESLIRSSRQGEVRPGR